MTLADSTVAQKQVLGTICARGGVIFGNFLQHPMHWISGGNGHVITWHYMHYMHYMPGKMLMIVDLEMFGRDGYGESNFVMMLEWERSRKVDLCRGS